MAQEKRMLNVEIRKNDKLIENLTVQEGTLLDDIAKAYDDDKECRILIAMVGYRLRELTKPIESNGTINFLTIENFHGYRTLERALLFIFIRAACEITGKESIVRIEHALDKGVYCQVDPYIGWINEDTVKQIEQKMHEIIAADDDFEKYKMSIDDAKRALGTQYNPPKLELLNYRDKNTASVYKCGWLWDYFYGALPVSTGRVTDVFELKYLENGILLRFPSMAKPGELPEFKHDRMMFEIYREAHTWMETIEIPYVAKLNKTIENGNYRRVIQVAEGLHEKKIAQIADSIASIKKRIVLIAGPSSSGKTSFAQRLAVQLNVHGIRVCTLSTDDYFIDREFVAKDEKGNYLFEDLEAVDVELFNKQLNMLLNGEEVDLPEYDFIQGKKIFGQKMTRLRPNETIVIEGIHGLNEKLTEGVKAKDKFKIYISPLTALAIDNHNRIPTSDARLFRRIVRDYRTRGKSARDSIRSWPAVRAGEEKNIFPFQEEADIMFNSALPYELAVFKKYAKPLLEEVTPEDPEYADAERLLKMLSYFLELPDERRILNNSLLKEFIGGSCLFGG